MAGNHDYYRVAKRISRGGFLREEETKGFATLLCDFERSIWYSLYLVALCTRSKRVVVKISRSRLNLVARGEISTHLCFDIVHERLTRKWWGSGTAPSFFPATEGKRDRVRGGIGAIIIDREGEAGKIARINLTNYWCLDKPVSLRSWTDGEERKKRRNVVAVVISATRTSDRK